MSELVLVKLGGSIITDKTKPDTARPAVIARLAEEVASACVLRPGLTLVLGHGSGSFGHTVARQFGTHQGVQDRSGWRGFAQVAAVAARLNRIVADVFLTAGVPVWTLQPSASALCRGRRLLSLATHPIEEALARGLVPLVYGDVALDELQGGTIISTEQIFAFIARQLHPARLVLVGAVDGVYDGDPLQDPAARQIPEISAENWADVQAALGGSHATDVTGGMLSKVEEMVSLAQDLPGLTVRLVSGEREGALKAALLEPADSGGGTLVRWT